VASIWRLLGSSDALGFSLFFFLEAVGEFVEQAAISQGVTRPDAPLAVLKAVDCAGSF
jgi:hypothetical protein